MDSELINTVEDAIRFLRKIEVETIGVSAGWIISGFGALNRDFELFMTSNEELIEHARYERDMCVRLCEELGLESVEELME
jgi:hypothetical protein